MLRVGTKNTFSDLNEIVEAARQLHGRNSRDHGRNDEDHVPGNVARLHTEAQTQNENTGAAGVTDADAAQTHTDEDGAEQDNELQNEHDIHECLLWRGL